MQCVVVNMDRVTLQDIADQLDLSRAAVSMALRGTGRISEATRRRVRDMAKEMGYVPDPLMSAFTRHRQKGASPGSRIGIVGGEQRHEWQDPFFRSAAMLGYRLELFPWSEHPNQRALARMLHARGIAGVIMIEGRDMPLLEPELWAGFRGAYCGHYPSGDDGESPFPIVRHNPFDALSLAWRKGVQAGCRRIALLMALRAGYVEHVDEKTLGAFGYRQENEDPPLAKLLPRLITNKQARAGNAEVESGTRQWIDEQQPDLVICDTLLAHKHLLACGYLPPEDFRLIVLRTGASRPDIAGLVLDRVAVIQTAIFHLHTIIQHGPELQNIHTTTMVLNPLWQDGASFPAA